MLDLLKSLSKQFDVSVPKLYEGVKYLKRYGYLSDLSVPTNTFQEAVKNFQLFFHIEPDGLMGTETLHAMSAPRCCMPDRLIVSDTARWNNKKELTYFVDGFVNGLGGQSVELQLIDQAFKEWAALIPLKFTKATSSASANILIGVGRGQAQNFDGAGGTLAWAQLPNGNNGQLRCRFDLDERFIVDPTKRGILFLNVAAHEFGHLLGLSHSGVNGALMAPYYNASIFAPQQNDDIARIVALYPGGSLPNPTPTPTPSPTPTPTPKPTKQQVVITVEGKVTDVKVNNV